MGAREVQTDSRKLRIGLRGGVVRDPARRDAQRREILEAASRVFARKGYADATMDDIAAELGTSKGVLYYQFRNKQDIIVETRQATSGGAAERLEAIAAGPGDIARRMERAVRDLVATGFEEQSRHVIQTSIASGLDPVHRARVRVIERRYEAALIGLLREGAAAKAFVVGDLKITAFTIIRACLSPAHWFKPDGGASAAEVADVVAGMVMRSLGATPGPEVLRPAEGEPGKGTP